MLHAPWLSYVSLADESESPQDVPLPQRMSAEGILLQLESTSITSVADLWFVVPIGGYPALAVGSMNLLGPRYCRLVSPPSLLISRNLSPSS